MTFKLYGPRFSDGPFFFFADRYARIEDFATLGISYSEADTSDGTLDGVRRRAILRATGLTLTGAEGVRPNWAACVIEEDTKSASISDGSMRG